MVARLLRRGVAGALLLAVAGCASGSAPPPTLEVAEPPSPSGAVETVRATEWVRTSAEYRALSLQAYSAAGATLEQALADSGWTAALEQEGTPFRDLPPAVILDVDETVLDNSPFQERMIRQDSDFDPGEWARWVDEASAEAVPGALSFTRRAAQLGVVVFYVTNRDAQREEATRKNLVSLGFPVSAVRDVVLTEGERPDWSGDKSSRRAHVAESYRVLLLGGDDLNDFVPADGLSLRARQRLLERHRDRWGERWIVLPNPVYGSWRDPLGG